MGKKYAKTEIRIQQTISTLLWYAEFISTATVQRNFRRKCGKKGLLAKQLLSSLVIWLRFMKFVFGKRMETCNKSIIAMIFVNAAVMD